LPGGPHRRSRPLSASAEDDRRNQNGRDTERDGYAHQIVELNPIEHFAPRNIDPTGARPFGGEMDLGEVGRHSRVHQCNAIHPFENPQFGVRKVSETPSGRASVDAECCFVYCPARGDAVSRLLAKTPLSGPLWQLGVHPSPAAQGPEEAQDNFAIEAFGSPASSLLRSDLTGGNMLQIACKWSLLGAALGALVAIGSLIFGMAPADFSAVLSRLVSLAFSGAVGGCVAALLRAFIIWSR